jgi:23S rRNA (guanosine2251-2'-O)-methyltransferase
VAAPEELDERALLGLADDANGLVVVLDGITDPQNLGAAARSSEAAGVTAMVTRTRRAAPLSAAAIRASGGALLHLPLARVPNLTRTLERLKDLRYTVVGLDHTSVRTIHDEPAPERPLALVLGAEDTGLSRLVRETCDVVVSIPMAGRTASLNASAALAVALFGYATRPLP